MEHIPAIHAMKVGMRYPAIVLDVYRWGLTLYFDLTQLAPGRSPRVNAVLLFEKTLMPDEARELGENDRLEVALIAMEFGNHPTASLPADPDWLTWSGGTVRLLARRIRETGETNLLPILADALEDAGCEDASLLARFRDPQTDGSRDWAVELLATQA